MMIFLDLKRNNEKATKHTTILFFLSHCSPLGEVMEYVGGVQEQGASLVHRETILRSVVHWDLSPFKIVLVQLIIVGECFGQHRNCGNKLDLLFGGELE